MDSPGGEGCAAGVCGTPAANQSLRPNDMEKSTKKKAEREFLISDYFKDEMGKMRCEKPKLLPCGGKGCACQVWIHGWRDRVEGPDFKLMIVYCKTHNRHFTVYPRRATAKLRSGTRRSNRSASARKRLSTWKTPFGSSVAM